MLNWSSDKRYDLIIAAFPDFYIKYPDAWHKTVLQWFGKCKDDMVNAGHNCVILVDHVMQSTLYLDFGRYATPYGYGRARWEYTDPDTKLHAYGSVCNVIKKLASAHSVHHGAGPLYASIIHGVDGQELIDWFAQLVDRGFIPYDIFKKDAMNCSRFVQQAISVCADHRKFNPYFRHCVISPTPLDTLCAVPGEIMKVHNNQDTPIKMSWTEAISFYFKERRGYQNDTSRINLPDFHWVGSMAIGNYYALSQDKEDRISLHKYSQKGEYLWTRRGKLSSDMDLNKSYKLALGQSPNQFKIYQEKEITLELKKELLFLPKHDQIALQYSHGEKKEQKTTYTERT